MSTGPTLDDHYTTIRAYVSREELERRIQEIDELETIKRILREGGTPDDVEEHFRKEFEATKAHPDVVQACEPIKGELLEQLRLMTSAVEDLLAGAASGVWQRRHPDLHARYTVQLDKARAVLARVDFGEKR